jgi:hypothetical protein
LKKVILPTAILIFAVCALTGLTWAINHYTQKEDDPERIQAPPKKHTILLIDQTDTLNHRCCLILKKLLKDLPEEIKVNEAVSIFSIYQDSDITLTPILHVRNPGKNANEFIENVKYKREIFRKEFLNPLMQASSNSTLGRIKSPSSPIIETINNILSWHKFSSNIPSRKLIIYSDLLQNSVHCSDYPSQKIVRFKSAGCPEIGDLSNVDVEIYYILRAGKEHLQTPEHRDKWMNRFLTANASSVRFHDVL